MPYRAGRWARIFALAVLPGCATATVRGGYCAPPAVAPLSFAPDPPPVDGAPHEVQVAALVGLSGVTAEQVSQSIDMRVRVVERVELASLVIGATSAELGLRGRKGSASRRLPRALSSAQRARAHDRFGGCGHADRHRRRIPVHEGCVRFGARRDGGLGRHHHGGSRPGVTLRAPASDLRAPAQPAG